MNQDKSQYYLSVAVCETKRRCRNRLQDGPGRDPSCQFFTQKFWVKSESTLIFLSKNLSFERKITTNFDSRQKNPFGTNIEFYRKCIYLQLMPIQWHELSRIMVKMWYFVSFQPSKCRNTHIQPQIWSFWPIFPNNSESLPNFCYINWKKSEILSKLRNSEPAGVSGPRARPPPCSQFRKQRRGGVGGLEDNWAGDWWRPMVAGDRKSCTNLSEQ